METSRKFNEQESLQLIHEMIASAKSGIQENGFFFLLWGWLVFISAISQVALAYLHVEMNYLPWAILMPLGGLVSAFYGRHERKGAKVRTYIDNFMTYLWGAFLVALFIVLAMQIKLGFALFPMVLVIYGIGTFVSGGVLKFRPLIFGGVFCWAMAITAFFVDPWIQLLLLALAVLVSYIIPGHILNRQYTKAHVQGA